jgi:hypothetical protein
MKKIGAMFEVLGLYGVIINFNILLVYAVLAMNISAGWFAYHGPVDGSEASYRVYGRAYGRITGPIGFREPAPVFPVRLLHSVGIPVELGAKITGVAALVTLVSFTLFFLKKRYGAVAGAIGALLLAANPYFAYYAVRGPGEIFPILFFLGFWCFVVRDDLSFKNMAAAALCAALAALSKIIFFFIVLAALALWALEERSAQRLRFVLYCALLSCALILPYPLSQASVFGRPLSLQENLLRQWRNTALEGPILEAPFNGGPLSPSQFMFGGGIRRFAFGLRKVFLSGLPGLAFYAIELFLGLLGFVFMFLKKSRPFALLIFVFVIPTAFIAATRQFAVGGIESRFYLGAFWLVCAYAGFGFQQLLEVVEQFLAGYKPRPAG